jgi:hypothetical protein
MKRVALRFAHAHPRVKGSAPLPRPEEYENFVQGRLGPAIAEALGDEASEPRIEIHELHDVIPS